MWRLGPGPRLRHRSVSCVIATLREFAFGDAGGEHLSKRERDFGLCSCYNRRPGSAKRRHIPQVCAAGQHAQLRIDAGGKRLPELQKIAEEWPAGVTSPVTGCEGMRDMKNPASEPRLRVLVFGASLHADPVPA
jgi:hypothetical protein